MLLSQKSMLFNCKVHLAEVWKHSVLIFNSFLKIWKNWKKKKSASHPTLATSARVLQVLGRFPELQDIKKHDFGWLGACQNLAGTSKNMKNVKKSENSKIEKVNAFISRKVMRKQCAFAFASFYFLLQDLQNMTLRADTAQE